MDYHQQLRFTSEAGCGIRHLEQLLPDLACHRERRGDAIRQGSWIHLLPRLVDDRMASSFEGFDESAEEVGDCVREEVRAATERLIEPAHLHTEVRSGSVEGPDREPTSSLHDDVIFTVGIPLACDDGSFCANPVGKGMAPDLVTFEDQRDPERLFVLKASADYFAVPRLENVQRQRGFREKDRMEGEKR